ncbi:uncharacterized protein TNCV_4877511 [Trichonephila clavipes]|nr:uncharacterized protein TNCV_4877511 [Trichonephila clavipes]
MNKANLLFTDTDSLTYEIETEDIFKDMGENLDLYDTSEYPQDHAIYSEKNKKRIGCFKDEMNSKPIIEFVGLRAKMYSMLTPDFEKKTAKGVSKVVIQQKLKHSNYLQCLKESGITEDVEGSRLLELMKMMWSLQALKDEVLGIRFAENTGFRHCKGEQIIFVILGTIWVVVDKAVDFVT